jgi:hypothetical protein
VAAVTEKRRRFEMDWEPEVVAYWHDAPKIVVRTGEWRHGVRYEMRGELSPQCARNLIIKLRRALRQIRDEKTRELDEAVRAAEGTL